MRRILWGALVWGALSWSRVALAEEKGTGFEVGLRAGYAIPIGKGGANATQNLSAGISGAIPLWLDLGYRATPELMIGAYGAYAFGFLGDTLDRACGAVDCVTYDIRLGAQLHYHFLPGKEGDPWIGLGVGYEWLTFAASQGGQDASITASGFEFVNLQAGLDFAPSKGVNFGLGPFVAFSVAEYSDASCSGAALGCPGDFSTTTHEWLTFGVRGTFVP